MHVKAKLIFIVPIFHQLGFIWITKSQAKYVFFRLQNASCWLVVVASSLFSLVAHTCIIIIYFECRGVIFSFFVFFGTFSLFRIDFVFWLWHFSCYSQYPSEMCYDGGNLFFRSRHTICTDQTEFWQRKNAWMNFAVAFRCSTRNMKNSVVHSKIVFHIRGLLLVKFHLFLSLLNVIMLDDKLHMCGV